MSQLGRPFLLLLWNLYPMWQRPPCLVPPARKHTGSHGAWEPMGFPPPSSTSICFGPGPLGSHMPHPRQIYFQPRRKQASELSVRASAGCCQEWSDLSWPTELTDFWAADGQSKAESERSWDRWTTHMPLSFTADLLWACSAIRSRLHMIQTTPLHDCTGKMGAPKN